ncbi:MAG: ATP-binding protein [Lachnospiraceae bacterium]|nr:ATP-binding protein [Lachnospiraceae bacterium]
MKKSLTLPAVIENLDRVLSFAEDYLIRAGCPAKKLMQFQIAVEEVYVNIAHYAYEEAGGTATVELDTAREPARVSITFIDSGKPYNPLEKEDPDITLPVQERQIGGLGVYMVKKLMDEVTYEYRDGRNILVITKEIGCSE